MHRERNLERDIPAEIGFDRVRSMTPNHVNERIQREMEGEIEHLKGQPRDSVQRRVFELEREWNIDQALMGNFAVLGLAGVLAGAFHTRKWLWAPVVQLGFLFMHASQGWCPPTSVFRRLGFRTQNEIFAERQILAEHLKSGHREESRPEAA